eukprot:6063824-Prymnesium_polylepis.1
MATRSVHKLVADALRCPICWDSIQQPARTPCGHSFCAPCIKAALQAKKECPVCRVPIASHRKLHLESPHVPSAPVPPPSPSGDGDGWTCP